MRRPVVVLLGASALLIAALVTGLLLMHPALELDGAPACASPAQASGDCTSSVATAVLFTDPNHTTTRGNTTTVTVRQTRSAPQMPDTITVSGTLSLATATPVTVDLWRGQITSIDGAFGQDAASDAPSALLGTLVLVVGIVGSAALDTVAVLAVRRSRTARASIG